MGLQITNKFRDMPNKELEQWYKLAVEYKDGRYIKRINEERNRREKYDY